MTDTADRYPAHAISRSRRSVTTWVFTRNAQSVRLARLASRTPQLLVIGPGCQRQLHIGRSEEDLGMLQLALEQRLQRHGWSYEGWVVE